MWVETGTVSINCLAQEHNTMSWARARTQTAGSRGERTSTHNTGNYRINPKQHLSGKKEENHEDNTVYWSINPL